MTGGSSNGRHERSTSDRTERAVPTTADASDVEMGRKSTGVKAGDGRSNRSRLTTYLPRLTWRQPGGLPECPYFYRWVLDFGLFSIRLHKWLANDDARAYHDHPYWFITLVLWGGYDDVSPTAIGYQTWKHHVDTLGIGSVRYRPAQHRHVVSLRKTPTWTLLLTGRPLRRWSFYRHGQAIKRDKYFAEYGHHPCDGGEPVRMRPDGTRI